MAEVDISKIKLPDGITYNLKSGMKGAGEVDISKIVLPDGTICNIKGGSSEIFAHLYVNADAGSVVTATSSSSTYTATSGSGDEAFIEIGKAGTYTISATKNGASSSSVTVSILESGGIYNETVNFIRLTISVPSGSTYSITDGTTTITGTSTGADIVHYLPNIGTWICSCTDETQTDSYTLPVTSYTDYLVVLSYSHVYGVSWDRSENSVLTRTDDAALFSEPNPYYSEMSDAPSSPFDNIMPWRGITIENINGNTLVKIPKFWYKITSTENELKFQISDRPLNDFLVSPAHRARNENESDRDYVYIGRYKSNDSDYKSTTNSSPMVSITRAAARTGCRQQGTGSDINGFYQQDYALFWTVRMLYLVEFSDWDSQKVIGYGCSPTGNKMNTGYTDTMIYHTGTDQTTRDTYGGTQYRYIEGLWDNVYEWCDGIVFSGQNVYVSIDPDNYIDGTSQYTNVGRRASTGGTIKAISPSSINGYDWALYVTDTLYGTPDYTKYITDQTSYSSGTRILCIGGPSSNMLYYGLFALDGSRQSSTTQAYIGTRLMYLPPSPNA